MKPDIGVLLSLAQHAYLDHSGQRLVADGFGDLRPGDPAILRLLHRRSGITVTDLASSFGISKQAASQAVASLEERTYVSHTAGPGDARRKQITLTGRGEALHRSVKAAALDLERKLRRRTNAVAIQQLARMLAEIDLVAVDTTSAGRQAMRSLSRSER